MGGGRRERRKGRTGRPGRASRDGGVGVKLCAHLHGTDGGLVPRTRACVLDVLELVPIGAIRLVIARVKAGTPGVVRVLMAVRGLLLLIIRPVRILRHVFGRTVRRRLSVKAGARGAPSGVLRDGRAGPASASTGDDSQNATTIRRSAKETQTTRA